MLSVQRPSSLMKPLVVPNKLLMGPGPSNCSPRVLQALGLPVLGHFHPECLKIMDEIKEGLQYVFQTKNTLTLAISTAGHGGMEAAMCNLIDPGDPVLIAVNGIWGERAAGMAGRYGAVVRRLEKPLGENFTIDEVERALSTYRPVLFFITLGESSTGVFQPVQGYGALCHKYNCLFVVDTVAALGGVPIYTDKWEIDVIYTGSQKVLGAPPGLAPISFSPRAETKILSRKTPVKVFYLDMQILGDYWACFGRPRVYHHTISSTLLYGLREGLALIAEEGLENCWERHQSCAKQLHAGITELGLELFVKRPCARLPTVTTISIPPGLDSKLVCDYAMKNYLLEISGGLGPTLGKVMRIGLMGHNATPAKVDITLRVLKEAVDYARKSHSLSKL